MHGTFFQVILPLYLGSYIRRQTERWAKQYEASKTQDIPTMDKLIAWLLENVPANDTTTVVHGDFRLVDHQKCIVLLLLLLFVYLFSFLGLVHTRGITT